MDQHVTRDRLVRPQQQDDQQGALLRTADLDHAPVRGDLQRPENPVVDHAAALPVC